MSIKMRSRGAEADFEDIPDDFFDDFENSNFLDEICDIVAKKQTGSYGSLESNKDLIESDDDHRLMNEIDELTKSIQCRKRKLRKAENDLANDFKKYEKCHSHRRRKSKSPSLDILKKAAERCRRNDTAVYTSYENSSERTRSSNEFIYDVKDKIQVDSFRNFDKPLTGYACGKIDIAQSKIFETSSWLRKIEVPKTSPWTCDQPIQQIPSVILSPSDQFNDQPHLKKIVNDIIKGFKVMILMRGPPGSGKSHLAQKIIIATTRDCYSDHIFSSYEYFYDQHGHFRYNKSDSGKSHEWNQSNVKSYAMNGWSPIIVDNSNIRAWEMNSYLKIAVEHGYLVEIVQPNTPWSDSVDELVNMNIHGVSQEIIDRMISNFQPTTVDDLMKFNGLKYKMPMPQYRDLPQFR